jgi:hypothetical protein
LGLARAERAANTAGLPLFLEHTADSTPPAVEFFNRVDGEDVCVHWLDPWRDVQPSVPNQRPPRQQPTHLSAAQPGVPEPIQPDSMSPENTTRSTPSSCSSTVRTTCVRRGTRTRAWVTLSMRVHAQHLMLASHAGEHMPGSSGTRLHRLHVVNFILSEVQVGQLHNLESAIRFEAQALCGRVPQQTTHPKMTQPPRHAHGQKHLHDSGCTVSPALASTLVKHVFW